MIFLGFFPIENDGTESYLASMTGSFASYTSFPSGSVCLGGKYAAGPNPYRPIKTFYESLPKNCFIDDDRFSLPKVALGATGS